MKLKTFDKKLALKKKTVANLNAVEMKDVRGGYETEIAAYCDSEICSVIHTFCDDVCPFTRVRTICD